MFHGKPGAVDVACVNAGEVLVPAFLMYSAVPVGVPNEHAVNISFAISTEASGGEPQGSHGSHIENVTTTGLQSETWGCLCARVLVVVLGWRCRAGGVHTRNAGIAVQVPVEIREKDGRVSPRATPLNGLSPPSLLSANTGAVAVPVFLKQGNAPLEPPSTQPKSPSLSRS